LKIIGRLGTIFEHDTGSLEISLSSPEPLTDTDIGPVIEASLRYDRPNGL